MPNVYTFKDFEGSSHRILIDLISRFSNGANTLLDLGAAGGELGEALRRRFKHTIGFEYDVDRIGDLRRHFDQAVIADLETVRRLPVNAKTIVLADILEHLRDPKALLECVRQSLTNGGQLFVSVHQSAIVEWVLGHEVGRQRRFVGVVLLVVGRRGQARIVGAVEGDVSKKRLV